MTKLFSGCQVYPVLQSNYQISVHCIDLVEQSCIIYDGKNFFWKVYYNTHKKEQKVDWGLISGGREMSTITYSRVHSYYFVFSDDWNVYILSKSFEFLKKTMIELKFFTRAIFLDHLQSFLLISKDQISQVSVRFVKEKSAIGQNKSAFRMEVKNNRKLKESLVWNKYCYLSYSSADIDSSYCIIYSNHSCLLIKLREVEPVVMFSEFIKSQNIISTIIYSRNYEYFVVGHLFGQISVWRVQGQKGNIQATHNFEGHGRAITSLILDPNTPSLLYSCSLDDTIKIWNIETFTAMISYPIPSTQFSVALFLSSQHLILQQDQQVSVGQVTNIIEHLHFHNSNVRSHDKEYLLSEMESVEEGDQIQRVQVALVNNIILCVNSLNTLGDLEHGDNNRLPISIYFAPPISRSVISIMSSPYEQEKYYMHFESGEFCSWSIKSGKTHIDSLNYFKDIVNIQGYPTVQSVGVVKLLQIIPSFYDMETKLWESDYQKASQIFSLQGTEINTLPDLKDPTQYKNALRKMKFIALVYNMGCKKGAVIFLSLLSFNIIYLRMSLHKEEVLDLGVMRNEYGDQIMISYAQDMIMKFTSFANCDGSHQTLKILQFKEQLNMKCFESYIITSFVNQFTIFKVDGECNLTLRITDGLHDHDSKILFVDIEKTKRLIMASSRQTIKIFDFDKVCLLSIQFHLDLALACFANLRADILVSIDGGLAICRNIQRYIGGKSIKKNDSNHIQMTVEEFLGDDFTSILKQKEQEQEQEQEKEQEQEQEQEKEQEKESHLIQIQPIDSEKKEFKKIVSYIKQIVITKRVIDAINRVESDDKTRLFSGISNTSTNMRNKANSKRQIAKSNDHRQVIDTKQQITGRSVESKKLINSGRSIDSKSPIALSFISHQQLQSENKQQSFEDHYRLLIPALPNIKIPPLTAVQKFVIHKRQNPSKNRRDWTLDKIILKNLAFQEQQYQHH